MRWEGVFRVSYEKMNKGWCKCDQNIMHFYPCGYNIPRIVNNLSNYIDLIEGDGKTGKSNTLVEPHASEPHIGLNDQDTEN